MTCKRLRDEGGGGRWERRRWEGKEADQMDCKGRKGGGIVVTIAESRKKGKEASASHRVRCAGYMHVVRE